MNIHFLVFTFICTHSVIVLIAADDNDIIPYQSFCDPSINSDERSDNFNCRCSIIVPIGERICALQMKYSSATPYNLNDKCNTTDAICIVDNRCNGDRLCYPVSFTNPDIYPSLATNDNINSEQ